MFIGFTQVALSFRDIRQFLIYDVPILVANALVSSKLDYCNSLSEVSASSIYLNCNAFKIVQLQLYQTQVDVPV